MANQKWLELLEQRAVRGRDWQAAPATASAVDRAEAASFGPV
jgi:hypothetical protein